jgi:hypothetical protein
MGYGVDVIPFVQSLVQRIVIELKECHERCQKENSIINKCWDVIILITSKLGTFMPAYSPAIEEQLKPLFEEFMADPEKFEFNFENNLVLTIGSFIKKTNQISSVMWNFFPLLIKVFEKSMCFVGDLVDTINQYIIIGKQ